MKSRTCILYYGVDGNHDDPTGNGCCLDVFLPDASCRPCKEVIAEKRCPKGRITPYEVL